MNNSRFYKHLASTYSLKLLLVGKHCERVGYCILFNKKFWQVNMPFNMFACARRSLGIAVGADGQNGQ